ncbi:hypothetical protein [Salmonella enterica]|uniref:hypothetical protein n=1 Tax=Salmonella enterica TaxID=28901 RepID=UPI0035BE42B8
MVLFIGDVDRATKDREAFQEIDFPAMFGPIAKWAAKIDDARRIPEYVARAWNVAMSGRPGPVVLALPEDMLLDEVVAVDRPRIDRVVQAADWLGPGRGQMYDTLDHVAKAGFTWFGDWVLDDQPIWVKTAHGPLVAIPYSAEINDITMMVSHHHESDVLFKRTKDAFDRLYDESKESTRIIAIGVHPYVRGQAPAISTAITPPPTATPKRV